MGTPDAISALRVTEAAIEKLGARGITTQDARKVPRSDHNDVPNPHAVGTSTRRLLIGRTTGGRARTQVIEQSVDPTTWPIVTGWDASAREGEHLKK